jgi:hypothetical protein
MFFYKYVVMFLYCTLFYFLKLGTVIVGLYSLKMHTDTQKKLM